jgi:hypothetical protein
VADAELRAFLEEAGRSLGAAQDALVGSSLEVPTQVAISSAELEIKAGFTRAANGALQVQPVSVADIVGSKLEVGAISTLKVQFVAIAEDAQLPGPAPVRKADDVIKTVRGRADVAALVKILDDVRFEAVFVPPTRRWLVRATDAQNRVVREVLVPDA